ncbi:MAG: thiamine pyrophosphate-dependent dehydrogenase E1 component subunit alpha [Hyphomicrobiaceae bacterium]
MDGLDASKRLSLLRLMLLIREAELRLAQLFADGEIPGFIHLSVGQEAIAAGVCAALLPGDTVASNHRGHGHALAKGLDVDRFFLEIMGKAEGMCRGRGGSMHVADASVGMLGANGIVAAGLPIALGSALAHQIRRSDNIAVVFFGDGALAEGVVHETFNMAALWQLPILMVCENNGWSEFSPTSRQFAADPTALARAHGVEAETVDGNDVDATHATATRCVAAIRAGGGPRFLEARTIRVRGHFEGDPQKYREDTADPENDPIARLTSALLANGVEQTLIQALHQEATARIETAVAHARSGNTPTFEAALSDVYAGPGDIAA